MSFIANSHQTPNVYADRLYPLLTEAELRVLLYMTRQVFGWVDNRRAGCAAISIAEIVDGRVVRGERKDLGAGVGRTAAIAAIKRLIDFGVVAVAEDGSSHRKTVYALQLDPEFVRWSALEERRQATSARRSTRAKQTRKNRNLGSSGEPNLGSSGEPNLGSSGEPNLGSSGEPKPNIYIDQETKIETKIETNNNERSSFVAGDGIDRIYGDLGKEYSDEEIARGIETAMRNEADGTRISKPANYVRKIIDNNRNSGKGMPAKQGSTSLYRYGFEKYGVLGG